ncbi:nicotinate mononucleotide-dependent phosphoribosyltransferase CobT [Atribacter laminatus]|uniref:Uncharacterized protein n=1 Tax=Atribacter laminatus TaxID=2847778 RepID=A0A7T1ALF0_ATRLM|nr:TIGR00303 family protein [Atribacter laminatus]QPM68062.1 hypothetical protein RT761_01276 [Atribacter laminatus]
MFVLVISGSDVSKIPGVSIAGLNPEVIPYTAPADADLLLWGKPHVIDAIPVDPQGHPTPAIITHAACCEAGFPILIVRSGTYLPPVVPYIEMNVEPGQDPQTNQAVSKVELLVEKSKSLGQILGKSSKKIVIAESLPGGTTTAYLILKALGYNGMVSSASPVNPVKLKEQIWENSAQRIGIKPGGLSGDPMKAIRELGDPMQATVFGMVTGVLEETDIILAGGTQMLAVAALLRHAGYNKPLLVATTTYVIRDKFAHFLDLARQISVEIYSAPLDFSQSPYPGLSDYEKGYVKEGVGAGGAIWYAEQLGVTPDRVIRKTEQLYHAMIKKN